MRRRSHGGRGSTGCLAAGSAAVPGGPDGVAHRLPVSGGEVFCPRRGRVDVAVCLECPEFRGLSPTAHERVLCGLPDGLAGVAGDSGGPESGAGRR